MKASGGFGALRLLGGVGGAWLNVRLAWRLLGDPRVPLRNKMIMPLTAFYFVWPLDFVPDLVPFLGRVDDLTAIAIAILLFVRTSPRRLVAEHRADLMAGGYGPRARQSAEHGRDVIDGEFRVIDDDS
jgi:uncharacterized membrane protein YkvA (DUF1232 family)